LCALDYYISPRLEIAICGNRDTGESENVLKAVYNRYLPNKIVAAYDPHSGEKVSGIALLNDRGSIKGRTTVYICRGNTCQAPITEVDTLITALDNLESSNNP
jgi:hypothetical protein